MADTKEKDANVTVDIRKEIDIITDSESTTSSSFEKNPFLDPVVAEHYREVYEKAQYECRSAFDPEFEWEPQEEKKLAYQKVGFSCCIYGMFDVPQFAS